MNPSRGRIVLRSDPYNDPEAGMEFRLTYEGILLGASKTDTRARHKQEIRRVFNKQLRRLWSITPHLSETPVVDPKNPRMIKSFRRAAWLGEQFSRCGYKFAPLVTEKLSLLCAIEVLFLRPDRPGALIRSGDIDNRIKTLLDALRMPGSQQELGGYDVPAEGEDPFFVLLEDDKLVTRISVDTDALLQPTGTQFDDNDTRLIITVKIRPYALDWDNINFS